MKTALSISVGSTMRDHVSVVSLLGHDVRVERKGTDGDFDKANQLYREWDGRVDAFGVGGVDLGVTIYDRHYPFYDALRVVEGVTKTPYTDGDGLKNTLERRVIPYIQERIGNEIQSRRALVCTGADRFGMPADSGSRRTSEHRPAGQDPDAGGGPPAVQLSLPHGEGAGEAHPKVCQMVQLGYHHRG